MCVCVCECVEGREGLSRERRVKGISLKFFSHRVKV